MRAYDRSDKHGTTVLEGKHHAGHNRLVPRERHAVRRYAGSSGGSARHSPVSPVIERVLVLLTGRPRRNGQQLVFGPKASGNASISGA
ncbi:MAG: hypothetical protein OXD42_06195 [Rhodospirillaceae bacterium]|nr:hypothetical protein [Rhodospirillaceae bacterium]